MFDRLARLGFVCYDVYDVVAKRDYYRVATGALKHLPLDLVNVRGLYFLIACIQPDDICLLQETFRGDSLLPASCEPLFKPLPSEATMPHPTTVSFCHSKPGTLSRTLGPADEARRDVLTGARRYAVDSLVRDGLPYSKLRHRLWGNTPI